MTDTQQEPHAAPRHWEADVLLRDGHTAHIRPIRPDDAELLVEFYGRVSDQSKYFRFFTAMPTLSERDVQRFTQVDHVQRVAFVVTLKKRIIALGSYEGDDSGRAEVAFLVEDAQQGRGIGQLLLEHLAQAGRERGFGRFVAEVLPDNERMIQTFRDAGYRLVSGIEDGVMSLEFPIEPTDTFAGVMAHREHRAEAKSIETFFNPRSVAVIGASRRQDTIGQALVRHLVLGDYTGRVYVVNDRATSVSGMPAHATVSEIPDDVDVAIVAVPADSVQDVVLDCANKGVHGLVVISSGFAETGEEGRQRQRRLLGLCRSYGLRLIGPNCLGIINTDPAVQLNASLSSHIPARGRAGFFCQSGALGSAILEKVTNRGLGLSTFVSAGNRADVSGNDVLQYWEEDDATEVVLLYLESIGNPRKFSRIARRVSLRKPIIAVRSGRTTQGVPMGQIVRQIAAPGRAVDAMFRQAGVIQVDTLDAMFDVAQLLAHQPLPRGRRVAIVGNSDAIGLLAADAASSVGLVVNRSVSLGADAGGRRLRGRPRRGHRRPRGRLRGRGLRAADQHLRRGRRPPARRGRRAVRQADRLVVPRRRGRARAAAGARRGRIERRARLGAVVPRHRVRGPGARLRRRVRRVVAHPQRPGRDPRRRRPGGGQEVRQPGPHRAPRRSRPRPGGAGHPAGLLRHRPVGRHARLHPPRGAPRRQGSRAGTSS